MGLELPGWGLQRKKRRKEGQGQGGGGVWTSMRGGGHESVARRNKYFRYTSGEEARQAV